MIFKRLIFGINLLIISCTSNDRTTLSRAQTDEVLAQYDVARKLKNVQYVEVDNSKIDYGDRLKFSNSISIPYLGIPEKEAPSFKSLWAYMKNKPEAKNNAICEEGGLHQSTVLFHIPLGLNTERYIAQFQKHLQFFYIILANKEYLKRIYFRGFVGYGNVPEYSPREAGIPYLNFYVDEKVLDLGVQQSLRISDDAAGLFLYDGENYQYLPPTVLAGEKRSFLYSDNGNLTGVDSECLSSPTDYYQNKYTAFEVTYRNSSGWLESGIFTIAGLEPQKIKIENGFNKVANYMSCTSGVEVVSSDRPFSVYKVVPLFDEALTRIVENYSIKPLIANAKKIKNLKSWRDMILDATTIKEIGLVGANKLKYLVTLDMKKICDAAIKDDDLEYK